MAIPLFVQAGAGAFIAGGGTGTVSMTGATAGNLIVVHFYQDGTQDLGYSAVTNIEMLNGTDADFDVLANQRPVGDPISGRSSVYVGRAISSATVSSDFTSGVGAGDIFLRLYEFSGEATGTTVASVFEAGAGEHAANNATGTTVEDIAVVTNGNDRFALHFVTLDDDQAIAEFTGETGGDWTEAVAEFTSASGAQVCLQLQTASMPSAGTIDGGSTTIGVSSGWGVIGTAIIPSAIPGPADAAPFARAGRGAGW